MVFALKNWKHCLYGEPFDHFIDYEYVYILLESAKLEIEEVARVD